MERLCGMTEFGPLLISLSKALSVNIILFLTVFNAEDGSILPFFVFGLMALYFSAGMLMQLLRDIRAWWRTIPPIVWSLPKDDETQTKP